jgi:hypothetical protein
MVGRRSGGRIRRFAAPSTRGARMRRGCSRRASTSARGEACSSYTSNLQRPYRRPRLGPPPRRRSRPSSARQECHGRVARDHRVRRAFGCWRAAGLGGSSPGSVRRPNPTLRSRSETPMPYTPHDPNLPFDQVVRDIKRVHRDRRDHRAGRRSRPRSMPSLARTKRMRWMLGALLAVAVAIAIAVLVPLR